MAAQKSARGGKTKKKSTKEIWRQQPSATAAAAHFAQIQLYIILIRSSQASNKIEFRFGTFVGIFHIHQAKPSQASEHQLIHTHTHTNLLSPMQSLLLFHHGSHTYIYIYYTVSMYRQRDCLVLQ